MEDKSENKYYLFGPRNEKDLGRQYPELKKEPEFKDLTTGELLFTWWYANATSPLIIDDTLSDKQRIMAAYDQSFKKTSADNDRKSNYFSSIFPDRVKTAIEKMKSFNPSARIRSRIMIEKMMNQFEKLINVSEDDFIEHDEGGKKKINWTGRNSYVTSAKNISEMLPTLIRQLEEGFGVIEVKEGEQGIKAIQRFHSVNEDK